MGDLHKKPGSPGDILEHHGIKGQKWGVRKKEDSAGFPSAKSEAKANTDTKSYMVATRKAKLASTPEGTAKKLVQDKEKFVDKFKPSDGQKSNHQLTSTQKKFLIGGAVGVAAIGAVYLANKNGVNLKTISGVKPGEKISVDEFRKLRILSQNAAVTSKATYLTDASFTRPAFELPAGHTFHRLSTGIESDFGHATYSLSSVADLNRYLVSFGGRGKLETGELNHVTWQATKPVRVPALTEVLNSVRDVMADEKKVAANTISHDDVLETYSKWSGGGWANHSGYGGGGRVLQALKRKGYGAIIDEADAGILGERPLVFFGQDHVTPKKTTPVTVQDLKTAAANLTEMYNRKH